MEWPAAYALDEATGIRVRGGRQVAHDYTDGPAAEAYILDAIQTCRDVSSGSDELVQRIRDWPSEYHFSASRPTLLAPFDLQGLSVLEVGCGCGALTRYLGESGARVVALEGSLDRARITAARCRGLDGVQVVCDDFRDFVPPGAFDVVLMVGVLEYAPLYFEGPDPIDAALHKAGTCLAEDAALVVAIENQLGLKYFAGCTEDHSGQAFYGIEDRYRETVGPLTFGRGELTRRLKSAGYTDLAWYYPFPDYKLPRLLLTEDALREPRLHAGRLAAGLGTRDFAWPHPHVFAEDAAWEVIDRNGLVGDLANSFLVVASAGGGSRLQRAPDWLAELHTTDRVRAYRTVTRFVGRGDELRVVKVRSDENAAEPRGSPVGLLLPMESPLVAGSPLGARMRRLLRAPATTAGDLGAVLRPWVELLRSAVSDSRASHVPGDRLDLVPWNLIEPEASPLLTSNPAYLTPFDLEWEYRPDLTLEHVVFRGLVSLLVAARGEMRLAGEMTVAELLRDVAGRLGVVVSRDLTLELLRRDAEIQSAVFGMDQQATLDRMTAQLGDTSGGASHLELSIGPRDARIHDLMLLAAERDARIHELTQLVADREERARDLEASVADLEASVADLEASVAEYSERLREGFAQLAAVEASASWKLTAPLRRLRRLRGDAG